MPQSCERYRGSLRGGRSVSRDLRSLLGVPTKYLPMLRWFPLRGRKMLRVCRSRRALSNASKLLHQRQLLRDRILRMHFEVSSNPRNDGCIPSIELGEKCLKDYECVAENSRCIDICSCKVDHVLSKDGKQCLKVRNSVGESCQENSQCQLGIKDSECGSDGKCSCIENFHQRGSVCFRDMMLNDRCQSHRDCVTVTYKHSNITEVMNVDCIDNTCVCAKDYIMSKELYDCIRYSDNGAESTISWQQIFRILPFIFFSTFLII